MGMKVFITMAIGGGLDGQTANGDMKSILYHHLTILIMNLRRMIEMRATRLTTGALAPVRSLVIGNRVQVGIEAQQMKMGIESAKHVLQVVIV